MASPSDLFLTNTNYFSWKSHMEYVLRIKGLYQITLGTKQAPYNGENKVKWDNKNDKACGLIIIFISLDLRFHLQGINGPNKACKNLEVVFGKHNIIQTHRLENQLMNLNPNDFPCIEEYLSKFKTLIRLCIDCKLDLKKIDAYMLFLLSLVVHIIFLYLPFMPL